MATYQGSATSTATIPAAASVSSIRTMLRRSQTASAIASSPLNATATSPLVRIESPSATPARTIELTAPALARNDHAHAAHMNGTTATS